jgi:hypothetical protein
MGWRRISHECSVQGFRPEVVALYFLRALQFYCQVLLLFVWWCFFDWLHSIADRMCPERGMLCLCTDVSCFSIAAVQKCCLFTFRVLRLYNVMDEAYLKSPWPRLKSKVACSIVGGYRLYIHIYTGWILIASFCPNYSDDKLYRKNKISFLLTT